MKRRFENREAGTYWEAGVQGSWLITKVGTIGVPGGEHNSQMFQTVHDVEAEATKRIADKLASGYAEILESDGDKFEPALLCALAAERAEAPLRGLGSVSEGELAAWRAISEGGDFSVWAERLVFGKMGGPSHKSFADLAATMTEEVYGTALVCATFSNLQLLCAWDDDDERTYLVSTAPASGGYHRVYWFVARFLELDSKSWPSITSFLWRDRESAVDLPPMQPVYLDPITLSRRSTWLTCALAGVGTGSLEEDTRNAADVAAFVDEAAVLCEHPHLACYWLLHHSIAGNTEMLGEALERTKSSSHPWVRELREIVAQAEAGGSFQLGAIGQDFIEEFAREAPDSAFCS